MTPFLWGALVGFGLSFMWYLGLVLLAVFVLFDSCLQATEEPKGASQSWDQR